jgi:diadenosine tetraphosphate (Ap4A) HIT family hydrolase
VAALQGSAEACAICTSLAGPWRHGIVFESELWHVRHIDAPWGVAGWMMLVARRHVGGPAHFDALEAASFGASLCRFERVLERVTGALRIYTAALGESSPHFHCHMVPRYARMPKDAKAWAVFDLLRAAGAGEVEVDRAEVERITEAYRSALAAEP